MDVENHTVNHTVLDIGQALIEARENKQLSAQDIASQMNLSLSVIEKIEANIFKQEIPLAFIRGYLRSYAAKVNADVETLSVEFDRQTGLDGEPIQKLRVVSNFKTSRREVNSNNYFFKVITFLIVGSLLSFAGWETWKRYGVFNQDSGSELNSIPLDINSKSIELSLEQDNQTESNDVVNNLELMARPSVVSTEESSPELTLEIERPVDEVFENPVANAEQVIEEDLDTPTNTDEVSAQFTFTDYCWVQITDANGQVLAIGEKKPGKVMTIKGLTPFSVILGNPSAVSIIFNNENYDMSAYKPGQTAKFELGSLN